MSTTRKVTILGCGSSGGVPRVGHGWGACDPANPKNRRRRCSIMVEQTGADGTTRLIVDTSPDLREQLIGADVRALDGVLYTHPHADHLHGIDDLRGLAQEMQRRVDIYADTAMSRVLHKRFGYCFETPPGSEYPPILREHSIEAGKTFHIDGAGGRIDVMPVDLVHGAIHALGFRFGNIAYTPDVNHILPEGATHLHGLDIWIIDCLRYTPHPSHFSLDDALGWIEALKPARAVLTNLHNDLDYETLRANLPPHIIPAFDGQSFEEGGPIP